MKLKFKTANKQQLEAINSLNDPLLIVAGPGTGKTFTLINRALNLIVNYGFKPEEILFATFTEKAANELITRLSFELDKNGIDFNPNEMYIGTFHSICLRIIKDNLAFTNLKIAPNRDYHWYRQNYDGTWSHKPGGTAVTDLDRKGNLIYDPESCDRTTGFPSYSEFVGFYQVNVSNMI